jgi:hypothetical protein
MVMVLSNTLFGKGTVYATEDQLQNCVAVSSNHTFTKDGKALTGRAYMRPKEPECDSDKLQPVLDLGRKIISDIQQVTSITEVLKFSYEIDTLKFSSAWTGCRNKADSLLDVEKEKVTVPSTFCLITNSTDPEYVKDPCCNSALSSTSCCLARNISTTEIVNLGVNNGRIEDACEGKSLPSSSRNIGHN